MHQAARRAAVVLTLASLFSPMAAAIPEGPADNTPEFAEREASNFARTGEATSEAAGPDFQLALTLRSSKNRDEWNARALADPSWVGLPSGNSPNTPAGAQWTSIATSDPTRYPDGTGPNGKAFYDNEAEVQFAVYYDRNCARNTAKLWVPKGWKPGDAPLPGVIVQNGSIQATQPMYWWMAQALVRAGYAVMSFDPRGQGRSDLQTPDGEQGGNVNSQVFFTGMVDAIDFFRSSLVAPYPHNVTCAGTYPTAVTAFNPFFDHIDATRLGIAGHSLGASGISSVQGYEGSAFQFPDANGGNPVDVLVAWDALGVNAEAPPRVPAMGQTSEYSLAPSPKRASPDPEGHKAAFAAYKAAGVPAYQFTIQGSTHYEWSLVPGFPATSWCGDISSGSCLGGWGRPMAEHYSLAWFDRWLKLPGEAGYADADARLLDDAGEHGCPKFSFYSRSARNFPDRGGKAHATEDIRADCLAGKVDTPLPAPTATGSSSGSSGSGSSSGAVSSSSSGGVPVTPAPADTSTSLSSSTAESGRFGGGSGSALTLLLGLLAWGGRRAARRKRSG